MPLATDRPNRRPGAASRSNGKASGHPGGSGLFGKRGAAPGLVAAVALLAAVAVVSIMVGSKSLSPAVVWDALWNGGHGYDVAIVRSLRVPRAEAGILVGAALGVAGALMQALTRNPLADPGILGINAGAAVAVVLGISLLGVGSVTGYVWFAFAGAALATVLVYVLGSAGRGGATPVRLALAGTAIAAALVAVTRGITLTNVQAFDKFRFWDVGSLVGRGNDFLVPLLPFFAAGLVLSFALAGPLNAMALGDDTGKALGAHLGLVRTGSLVAVTLLCGAAVAAAGPIAFVGLTIPHIARALVGPNQHWVLPYSAVLGPILLLGSDIVGRVVASPGEIQVGIVTAFVGAPVFIALVRRRKLAQL
ncbi:FecCD family ABC transporter permease [Spelaeicoccus albus]|uniref:Iron complex transport system permease protein n=1 Tax=Spelaeicoccus albus TaxID=1280376 RepID=A0A7Z0D2X8_9MICO|nr:iron chelate uptake ABC transporter family permease subunit [Spelaeicoccus albus]NYI67902.1 iron complex transport system permease protein [Spelaeicoccus albus]